MPVPAARCTNDNDMEYLTFWAVVAFSLFIASGEIVDDTSLTTAAIGIRYATIALRSATHCFALNVLVITLLEALLYHRSRAERTYMCNRRIIPEVHTVVATGAILAQNLVDTIAVAFPTQEEVAASTGVLVLCTVGPWMVASVALVHGVYIVLAGPGN